MLLSSMPGFFFVLSLVEGTSTPFACFQYVHMLCEACPLQYVVHNDDLVNYLTGPFKTSHCNLWSPTVLTPATSQVQLLQQRLVAAVGEERARVVDINTVDGF